MTANSKISKTLNITLWIVQVLLSITFIWAAYMKIFAPEDKVAAMWPWTANNRTLVKVTGVIDLLAAVGLILPSLLSLNKLTVYAAYGTILLMIAASGFHISRGEGSQIGFNIFVAVLAAFVAWGRRKG